MTKDQLKKIGNIIGNVISWILMALTVLILIFTAINVKNPGKMNLFGYRIGVVGSESMDPTIKKLDFILYKEADFDSVKDDQIILFTYIGSDERLLGQQIVHRVVDINEDGSLVTKGDNPKATVDEVPVTEDNFLGVYVWHTSLFGLGKLRENSMNPIFLLLTLVFIILIISSVVSIYKEIKKAKLEEHKRKVIEEYEAQKKLENQKATSEN